MPGASAARCRPKPNLAPDFEGACKKGFKFCGPTIVYAFMQAVGMVNDHFVDCFRHAECAALAAPRRGKAKRKGR